MPVAHLLQDLERRKKTKELEMLWRGAKSFGKEADVFLGTFPTGTKLMSLSDQGKGRQVDQELISCLSQATMGLLLDSTTNGATGTHLSRLAAIFGASEGDDQSHCLLSLLSRTGQYLLCRVQPGRARRLLCQGRP